METIKYNILYKTGTTYYINFVLTNKYDNIGLYSIVGSGTTNNTTVNLVTGTTESRLVELEKYVVSDNVALKYVLSGSSTNDGVVYNESTGNSVSYWIGGIKYIDYGASTSFSFYSSGITSANSFDTNIIVEDKNVNIVDDSSIDSDIDIERQSISVFENHYRLATATNLNDLITYAGGSYFNVIKNS